MNSKSPTIGLIKGRKVTIIHINSKWFRKYYLCKNFWAQKVWV